MHKITIIGINSFEAQLTEEHRERIASCKNFSGGERHHKLVKHLLPQEYSWVTIKVPMSNIIDAIKENQTEWIVFASGDPWFYGIANTLKREIPEAEIEVSPLFNSLQTLGHRLGVNYGEYRIVTLTGRPWNEFDKALINGEEKLSVLTDRKKTPITIAQHMLEYGYSNYEMIYGENLGSEQERICRLNLTEALSLEIKHPNCLFLEKTDTDIPVKMIPEQEFDLLVGRPNMITKMPVRLSTLASMQLQSKSVFWDIGACTGSISIEARLNNPHLLVYAFEIHADRMEIAKSNVKKFQCPGITMMEGDYLLTDKSNLELPDAVFIGGYGGNMEGILDDVEKYIRPGGVISFNSVTETSQQRFFDWAEQNDYKTIFDQQIHVDDHNPIRIITISKKKSK